MKIMWAWIACFIIIAQISSPSSCAEWPMCKFQCEAKEVTVSRLWLGDYNGDIFSSQAGEEQSCYLWAEFDNNANSPRYAVILLADLLVNGSVISSFYDEGLCVLDSIEPKSTQSYRLCPLTWSGGEDVMLKRLVLSWETAKNTDCSHANRKCSNRNTKCYSSQQIEVQVPLVASFALDAAKCPTEITAFYDRTTGGKKPYSYYWDFGDGYHSQEANPFHVFNAAGSYTVKLEVTDQSGTVSTAVHQVSVNNCSCSISGEDHACLTKVETYRVSFEDISPGQIHWTLDGIEIGQEGQPGEESEDQDYTAEEGVIDIDWSDYGSGMHELGAHAVSREGTMTAQCNMTITVITEPVATISLVP